MSKKALEDRVARELAELGISFVREFQFHTVRKWRADFCLTHPSPVFNILIEVEGGEFMGRGGHNTGLAMIEDCIKYNTATRQGYLVYRFTGEMVRNGMVKDTMKAILEDRIHIPENPRKKRARRGGESLQ